MKTIYLLLGCYFFTIIVYAQKPKLVGDITAGKNGTTFYFGCVYGDNLFFCADTTMNRRKPAVYTTVAAGGVIQLHQFSVYTPKAFTHFANKIFFLAHDTVLGYGLWASDGTIAGTTMIKYVAPFNNTWGYGLYAGRNDSMAVLNNKLYFAAPNAKQGSALWVSDGTDTGTYMLKDIDTTNHTNGGIQSGLFLLNNALYFVGINNFNYVGFWKTDGTVPGTMPLGYGWNATYASFGNPIMALNKLFFSIWDQNPNSSIPPTITFYSSDGTNAGTHAINFSPLMVSDPKEFVEFNNELIFYAEAYTHSSFMRSDNLWCTDGQSYLRKLDNLNFSCSSNYNTYLTNYNNTAYYGNNSSVGQGLLCVSDGNIGGTGLLMNLSAGNAAHHYGGHPSNLVVFNNRLYFKYYDYHTGKVELYTSDGTMPGTFMITDSAANSQVVNYCTLEEMPFCVAVGNNLYYTINYDSTIGNELYKIDTTITLPLAQNVLQNNVHSYIYPNPFGGELFINDVPEQSRYVITNILGMPISSGVVQQSRTQLNTYHWPSGMYIVSIITPDGNREVVKVLK